MVLKYANIINSSTGECIVSDIPHQGMKEKRDVSVSEIDHKWYLTSVLDSDRAYQLQVLNKRKQEKYSEITNNYDKACNYGVAPVRLNDNSYFANRSWLSTWSEAITGLEYRQSLSSENIQAFVRLYEKVGDRYKNITIENISIDQYKALYLDLINYRFNVLQADRNSRYVALQQAEKVEDLDLIPTDFGTCINEQTNDEKLII